MPAPLKPAASPFRAVAREGFVRVSEYHCSACAGDPPQVEQFPGTCISIVRAGVFGIRSDQHTQLLSRGFLLLGNAGQAYEASHEHAGGDECLVFQFADGQIEALADQTRRGSERRPFARNVLPPLPRAAALQQLTEQQLRSGAPAMAMGLEQLALSLAQCVLDAAGSGSPRRIADAGSQRRGRDQVFTAISLIERASDEPLGLAELAAAVGLSPFHFVRLFKREIGVTPYRFLLQTRIRRAVALLRDTTRPVTAIAFDVGFGDLSNFMHAFRRELGCSPGQFRKSGLRAG